MKSWFLVEYKLRTIAWNIKFGCLFMKVKDLKNFFCFIKDILVNRYENRLTFVIICIDDIL